MNLVYKVKPYEIYEYGLSFYIWNPKNRRWVIRNLAFKGFKSLISAKRALTIHRKKYAKRRNDKI